MFPRYHDTCFQFTGRKSKELKFENGDILSQKLQNPKSLPVVDYTLSKSSSPNISAVLSTDLRIPKVTSCEIVNNYFSMNTMTNNYPELPFCQNLVLAKDDLIITKNNSHGISMNVTRTPLSFIPFSGNVQSSASCKIVGNYFSDGLRGGNHDTHFRYEDMCENFNRNKADTSLNEKQAYKNETSLLSFLSNHDIIPNINDISRSSLIPFSPSYRDNNYPMAKNIVSRKLIVDNCKTLGRKIPTLKYRRIAKTDFKKLKISTRYNNHALLFKPSIPPTSNDSPFPHKTIKNHSSTNVPHPIRCTPLSSNPEEVIDLAKSFKKRRNQFNKETDSCKIIRTWETDGIPDFNVHNISASYSYPALLFKPSIPPTSNHSPFPHKTIKNHSSTNVPHPIRYTPLSSNPEKVIDLSKSSQKRKNQFDKETDSCKILRTLETDGITNRKFECHPDQNSVDYSRCTSAKYNYIIDRKGNNNHIRVPIATKSYTYCKAPLVKHQLQNIGRLWSGNVAIGSNKNEQLSAFKYVLPGIPGEVSSYSYVPVSSSVCDTMSEDANIKTTVVKDESIITANVKD